MTEEQAQPESTEPLDKTRFQNATAFILGASGEVGKELLKILLEKKLFQKVVLIGRRELAFGDSELYKDVVQKVVDFDKLEEHKEAFAGCQVGFCCLGTTQGKAGNEGFYRVDHDYVLNSARAAKTADCSHFALVTSKGANPNSFFLYMKTKGEVERDVANLGFSRFSIFRPATLLSDRQEQRTGEKILKAVLKPVTVISPTLMSVPVPLVAKAMVYDLWQTPTKDPIENSLIHQMGKEFDKEF